MAEDTIKVCIRIRPFLESEKLTSTLSPIIVNPDDDETIKVGKNSKFTEERYDKVFFDNSSQEDVYKFVNFCTKEIIQGINCSLITYGQTGSGKTYTMFGKEWTNNDKTQIENTDEFNFLNNHILIDPFDDSNGIIPRMINNILTEITDKNFDVFCSFIQIYNEKIYDLLDVSLMSEQKVQKDFRVAGKNDFTTVNPINQRALPIREDKTRGIYIDGLTQNKVENLFDCINYLKIGENLRKKRQTNKNELSSRSHTIFMLDLFSRDQDENGASIASRIHFCDLAGSEKFDQNFKYNKIHFNEMRNINKSLCTLANVINALTNNSKFIPYRESKLTNILQNSLGGSSRTVIIATISPSIESYDETISTLQFAKRVTKVKVMIEPNKIGGGEDGTNGTNNKIIEKLTREVTELKQLLKIRKKNGIVQQFSSENEKEIMRLRRENEELKLQLLKANSNSNTGSLERWKKNNNLDSPRRAAAYTSDNENPFESNDFTTEENVMESKNTLRLAGRNVINNNSVKNKNKKKISYSTTIRKKKNNFANFMANNSMMKMLKDIERENDEQLQREIDAIKKKNYKSKK